MKHHLESLTTLPGVGGTRAAKLAKIGLRTLGDLMEFFPRDYVHRNTGASIAGLQPDQEAAVTGEVASVQEKTMRNGRRRLEATIVDGIASLTCIWFRWGSWITDKLREGEKVWVSGRVGEYNGAVQMMHPELELLNEHDDDSQQGDFWSQREVLPLYPLSEGLTQRLMRRWVVEAFSRCHAEIVETLPQAILDEYRFFPRGAAMQKLHFPVPDTPVDDIRSRFAYEELFYHQLMLARCHHLRTEKKRGAELKVQRTHTTQLKNSLPYSLTAAQKRVMREIVADMEQPAQMNRLLQGDVGSGKTIVTLFAMLIAVENRRQAALMAPTEVLAEQHYRGISKLLEGQPDVRVALLKGATKGKSALKHSIADGEVNIVIGTHALIQRDVEFHNLAFVAVDEQHRFGVKQRSQLAEHDATPHILHLSATPIPRSLALTLWGDLDISVLDEMPPGRKPVRTVWKSAENIGDVYNGVWTELQKGRQAYMVCPLVEQSEKQDLLDAETLYEQIKSGPFARFKCGMVHGRMSSDEKDEVMTAFMRGEIRLLVATTVVEVGVDCPNATVMVIEHAERFGLSQLHQLRGRVGRGADESWCYLVAHPPLSAEGRQRLQAMVSTTDGFVIAEKDLELRGPGDFFGTQQSGLPAFRHANVLRDQSLLQAARADALAIVAEDAEFEAPEHSVIRQRYFPTYAARERLFRQ